MFADLQPSRVILGDFFFIDEDMLSLLASLLVGFGKDYGGVGNALFHCEEQNITHS